MEIIKVTPRGYCKGVTRAISLAKKCAQEHPDKAIYVLGMLVHNAYVMKALEKQHIMTIDDKSKTRLALLDEIPAGSIVVFTAHGVAADVKAKAERRGLQWIDASCPDVVKTQEIVHRYATSAYEVFYIGKDKHPEAEAVCSISPHVHLIHSIKDIPCFSANTNIFVTNQTTMSMFDINALFTCIKERYPQAIFSEEICNATRIRQEAVASLKNQDVDVLYVVGDTHSNNSNRLAQIAREIGIPHVYLIDDVQGVEAAQLIEAKRVAITAGASTPTYLTNQVITYLHHWDEHKTKPTIDLNLVL